MMLKLQVDSGRRDRSDRPVFIEILVRGDINCPDTVTADVRQQTPYNDGIWTPIAMMGGELEVMNDG